jgi:RNA polymerase sigma-70 factor (ECF subfamily)
MFKRDPLANPEVLIKRVYAYVAYCIGDGPEAEDITSETFERALRYRASYKPAHGEPVSWPIGISRRVIADAVKARLELAEPDDLVAPGELESEAALRIDVARAMALLDERNRELLALRFGADLTAKQIAAVLGVRTNAVEVALHRALGRLRTLLEDPHPEGGSGSEPVRNRVEKQVLPDA